MQNLKSENLPAEQALRGDEKSPTHLTVLINRVKEQEKSLGYVTKEPLINIAEYITFWPGKFTKEEYDEAVKLLAKYNLATLIRNRKKIQKALEAKWIARCARCGRAIWSEESLRTGYGGICRRKLGIKTSKKAEGSQNEALL